jgi:arsenate reductase
MKRVLFVCTQNAARSQLAEGLLNLLGKGEYEAISAGTEPAFEVHPLAVAALRERGYDTSGMTTKTIDENLLKMEFDLVVTVCDHAKKHCPAIPGAKNQIHWSIDDPADYKGSYYDLLEKFRETRNEIEGRIKTEILKL